MGRTLELDIVRSSAHIGIIHILNAGGVDASLIDFGNQAQGHMGILENRQHIKAVGRHGLQLQCNLSNDTQGTLAAHYQLLHAVACRALFKASAHFHDFTLRSNHFQAIHLVTGYTIAHCLVATSVSCKVSTNHAALSAAGVARIKEACIIGHLLNIHSAHACFCNHIHALGIHLNNLVQTLHQKDDATAYGDSAIRKAGTTAAHSDGHHVFVTQLHNGSNFLRGTGTHHCLGHAEAARIVFLVSFVHIKLLRVGEDIFFANNGLYLSQKFRADRIISSHYFPSCLNISCILILGFT